MKAYENREVENFTVSAAGTTNVITQEVPVANSYQISLSRFFVTASGNAVTAVTGDDATITVSLDGVNFFAPVSATVIEWDQLVDYAVISGHYTHIRISTAQILSTESVEYNISCISDR